MHRPCRCPLPVPLHLGSDPSQPDQLSSQTATRALAKYGEEARRIRGEEFDWQSTPIVPEAAHASGGGKPHGRLAIFNGVVDSRQARASSRASSSHQGGSNNSRASRYLELQSLREEL